VPAGGALHKDDYCAADNCRQTFDNCTSKKFARRPVLNPYLRGRLSRLSAL